MTETKFKLKDIFWGLILPLIIGLIIIALALSRPALMDILGMGSPIPQIITFGFAQMVVLGIPIYLGLNWNKYAGGAAGFLFGALYYLAIAGYSSFEYLEYGQTWNFFRDIGLVAYIVNGVLIGYIAGALNNKSYLFKRMLGASLTASITVGLLQFFVNYQFALEPNRAMTVGDPAYAFLLIMAPQVILGILVPIIARISVGSELWHA